MKNLFIISLSLFILACNGEEKEMIKEQDTTEVVVSADELYDKILLAEKESIGANNVVSNAKQMELKDLCLQFEKEHYNDKRAEAVLMKAIKSAMFLKNYDEAIEIIDKVIKSYGTEDKMPELLFHKAYILSESNWLGEADKVYSKIIKKYPNHHYAEQSKYAKELLYLSDEQLKERFTNQDNQ